MVICSQLLKVLDDIYAKKLRKRTARKQRDPSSKLHYVLGHKVEGNLNSYSRKRKHPEKIDDKEPTD